MRDPSRGRSARGRRGAGWALPVAACLLFPLLVPMSLHAHGDTIRVSYRAVQPARMVVTVGTTVHFDNANTSSSPCTVVIRDGEIESPALARGEGWHHTFDAPGEYAFFVKEYPSRRGVVVVTEP